jgi:N utilization substance protein B
MGVRHATRMLALQALYALEMNSESTPVQVVESAWEESDAAEVDRAFLETLVGGVWRNLKVVDLKLERYSQHWKISRMDRVDKSILRLAVYELLFSPETPGPVILNEGVELAKEFGTPESASFVNGILDRIAREARPGEFNAEA